MDEITKMLLDGNHSLVVKRREIEAFDGRGVSDLYRLLIDESGSMAGAIVADKVVGKAAAALMALLSVDAVYAHVISQPALDLLYRVGISVTYGTLVPCIINRAGTGICPLETRCMNCKTPEECLEQIRLFISEMRMKKC